MAGVAPFNRDSGEAVGKRHIRGGRTYLRTALYMAAFHASRINPVLAPFCKRLRERGKPYRVALVAVMRKLLVHLNHLVARLPPDSPAVPRQRVSAKTALSSNRQKTQKQRDHEDSAASVLPTPRFPIPANECPTRRRSAHSPCAGRSS